jgi:hypothetical protein
MEPSLAWIDSAATRGVAFELRSHPTRGHDPADHGGQGGIACAPLRPSGMRPPPPEADR